MQNCRKKTNVLFVIMQMEMGGSERLVHTLIKNLDRDRFNPSVAWFHGETPLAEFSSLNIPLHRIPKVKRFDISAMRTVASIIKAGEIDVVNAHHFMPMIYSYYGSKVTGSTRLIYTEHSEWEINDIPARWKAIGSYILKRTDCSVGVSFGVTKLLKEYFSLPDCKAVTIENGVEIRPLPVNGKREEMRMKLGLRTGELAVGIVANLKKVKNHGFLIEAFSELIKEHGAPVKLLIMGQGFKNDPNNTEREIRERIYHGGICDSVRLLGYRDDVPEVLEALDAFCLTSLKEGLPIGLIEAMSVGLPVVGTDVEGIREVIQDNRNGFLVKLGDTRALKDALKKLLSDPVLREQMGYESKSMAQERYSLKACIDGYQALFEPQVRSRQNML